MPLPDRFLGAPENVTLLATGQINAANAYLAQLGVLAGQIIPPSISVSLPAGPTAPPLGGVDVPSLEDGSLATLPPPDALTAMLTETLFPTFDGTPPGLVLPDAPESALGALPEAPGVNLVSVPNAPSVTLPAPPALMQLNVRAFNGVTIPVFDGGPLPTVTLVEPSVATYTPGTQYTSALLEALKTELHRRITEGGTGLNAAVEQAIYDRAREREIKALQDAVDGLERMEAMGFAFPPGTYLDARIKIETEYGKTQAGLSRDIMIKQAELELANVQEALKIATQLESQLIEYANQIEQRLFETAKYTTEAGIQVYNAKVEAYKAQLDAYRTRIAIYEAVIRAEIAKVDAYRAEIAAEQAKADINTALVNQYRVAADVALANVEIYRAQVQAAQVAAQIEQTRVAVYGEQIRAYAAKANAYTAEVEGYKARMQAETTKQEAYRTQVQAFEATISAIAKQADTRIAEYRGRIEAYTAQWDGYRSQAQAQAAQAQAIASKNSAVADMFRAQAQAVSSGNEVLTKQWQVALDQTQRAAEIAVAAAKASGELYLSGRTIVLEGTKVAAQVSSQLGAAALNAFNWSNSISSSESFTFSTSNSTSTSNNTNTNINL